MREATIDTHISAPAPSSRIGFGNARRARTAERGEIHQVMPHTSTRESRRAYENRMNQRAYMERNIVSSRRRALVILGILAAVVLGVAGLIASFVYLGGINSNMTIEDEKLIAALAEPAEEGAAVYTLFAASFEDGDKTSDPDMLMLVRTDPDNGRAATIVIPSGASARFSDGEVHRIGEAFSFGGDAEAVAAVEDLMGVQIGHYVKTEAEGFQKLVDELGGVSVTIPEEIVDPKAGDMKLSAGEQVLSGEQALFACRADDYLVDAEDVRSKVMSQVATGVFQKLAEKGKMGFYLDMDSLSHCVQTDMKVKDAYAFLDSLETVMTDSVVAGVLPTYPSVVDGVTYLVSSEEDIAAMMKRVRAGETPQVEKEEALEAADPETCSVTVNNGGGVEGAAADASAALEAAKFQIASVGNTAQSVYEETLVIYTADANAANAEAIAATLGIGRVVQDSVYYSFDTDILVVIGSDWQEKLDAE